MLPLDQRTVIEQTNFAYSPLGKAFEKQIKTIDDQGKKQIKAFQKHRKQLEKQKDILVELGNKIIDEIQNLSKQIDFNNITYYSKDKRARKFFIGFKVSLGFYEIYKGRLYNTKKCRKKAYRI